MQNPQLTRAQKTAIIVIVLLLILFFFGLLWKHRHIQGYGGGPAGGPTTEPVTSTTTPAGMRPAPEQPGGLKPAPGTPGRKGGNLSTKPTATTPSPATVTRSTAPLLSGTTSQTLPIVPSSTTIEVPAGQIGMHRELIPKNITIERCYYTEEVVNPGTQFYFEINGSGFDSSFYRSITVDPDALDVEVKDLKLVTANQIQGLMAVGEAATTQYIYPKIVIRGLPVFKAPDPFGVVRHGGAPRGSAGYSSDLNRRDRPMGKIQDHHQHGPGALPTH
jgi:hypothetical protein